MKIDPGINANSHNLTAIAIKISTGEYPSVTGGAWIHHGNSGQKQQTVTDDGRAFAARRHRRA